MNNGLRDFDAAFFDFDGVLADTEPIHFRCWREVLLGRGIDLQWEYYASECIGVSDRAMLVRLGALAHPPKVADELFDLYPLKKKMFRDACAAGNPIPRSTISALEAIRSLPLAVVTSSGTVEVEPVLLKSKVLAMLTTVVYGNEVTRLKPAPEPYLLAAERCHVRRALVFEDSAAGIASAEAAGHRVIRVDSPSDLPALIKEYLL